VEFVAHGVQVGDPQGGAVLPKSPDGVLAQRLDLGARDLREAADVRERELATPEQLALVEAAAELVALAQTPGERHQHSLGVTAGEAGAHELVARVELPIALAKEVGAANRLLAEGDLEGSLREVLRPGEDFLDVGGARHDWAPFKGEKSEKGGRASVR